MFNSFVARLHPLFYCLQDIQMSTPIAVPGLVRELVQFILATYPALEESLPYWTVSTTQMK